MLDNGFGVPHVGVLGHLVDRHARVFAHDLTHGLEGRVEGVDHGVDLDAVARRDDHRLADLRTGQQIVDDLRTVVVGDGESLEDRYRRAPMRYAEQENTHTPTDL